MGLGSRRLLFRVRGSMGVIIIQKSEEWSELRGGVVSVECHVVSDVLDINLQGQVMPCELDNSSGASKQRCEPMICVRQEMLVDFGTC